MKKELMYQAFNYQISKTAIVKDPCVSSDFNIIGRFCIIHPNGNDVWDIWLVGGGWRLDPLGTRKIGFISKQLSKYWINGTFKELCGEAHGKVKGVEGILRNLQLLGIRKHRGAKQCTCL